MDDNLQQGIKAAKAGDKPRAFDLLIRASDVPETSELAWLWLSSVVNDDSERLFCLDRVRSINFNNEAAQRGAEMLRQQGVFPSVPIYPDLPPMLTVQESSTPNPARSSKSSKLNVASPAPTQKRQFNYETNWKKEEVPGLFKYAVMELSGKKSPQAVEKLLVGQGASLEYARTVVKDAQYAVKKARRENSKKRMTRGLIWTIVGVVITCGTYAFADSLGGKYVLLYGAIGFGFFDFMAGLIGWLANG
jgi:hypothetical protein